LEKGLLLTRQIIPEEKNNNNGGEKLIAAYLKNGIAGLLSVTSTKENFHFAFFY
jgi:hypothetical protein